MERLPAENRRAVILTAAVELANRSGLAAVNHESVARKCVIKTTSRNVRHYYPKITELWKAICLDDRSTALVVQDAAGMGIRL